MEFDIYNKDRRSVILKKIVFAVGDRL